MPIVDFFMVHLSASVITIVCFQSASEIRRFGATGSGLQVSPGGRLDLGLHCQWHHDASHGVADAVTEAPT